MNHLADRISGLIAVDVVGSDFDAVIEAVEGTIGHARQALRDVCSEGLAEPRILHGVRDRIAYARTVVALLPDSLECLRAWLGRMDDTLDFEVHFTLFCYLDGCQEMPRANSLRPEVLRLVHDYLASVRVGTARAAWMAGDLLGDHWRADESLPVLLDLLESARYAAGREAALSGLETALRNGISGDVSRQAEETLRRVASHDRSPRLRRAAEDLLTRTAA